ncbi:PEP-CTERM sorting domain-containing protein [Desulfurivibrio sp. D14AmB]|uniref:PEP-CTERM sorting domain-containing protein n=1 Tax=Desulfurivibrio sp. D14AmB TaxID=3374370 RepID=UPI00376F06F4
MKRLGPIAITALFPIIGVASLANSAIITFTGGTAYLNNGTSVVTTDTGLWNGIVDYYIEGDMRVDFLGGYGTIGDYYNNSPAGGTGGWNDSVIHAHDFSDITIKFSRVDGELFDLTYVDMTSNTIIGGSLASGTERSFISNDQGYDLLLAPSDWGVNYTYYGALGDGVVRNWMDANFTGISYFTIWSENAYCFGMDNFYIDVEAPNPIPEPTTMLLFGSGLFGLAGLRRRFKNRAD